jgi:hypothetical protein
MEYTTAKNMNLRKPFIFGLLGQNKTLSERDINDKKKEWEQIEKDINNKNFNNIEARTRAKIIKLFEKKESEEYKNIKEIFSNETIEAVINFKGENALNLKPSGSSNLKKKKKSKIHINKEPEEKIENQISTSVISGKSTMATSNLYKTEENLTSENIITTRESYYMNNIFKNKLEMLMTLENKEIRIHNIIINSKIQMGLEDFNKCK